LNFLCKIWRRFGNVLTLHKTWNMELLNHIVRINATNLQKNYRTPFTQLNLIDKWQL
jgi:hypothetical protein